MWEKILFPTKGKRKLSLRLYECINQSVTILRNINNKLAQTKQNNSFRHKSEENSR